MRTVRFPVLLWKDLDGLVTAALVCEEEPIVAAAADADEALRQLKDYLNREHAKGWGPEGDLIEARLETFGVPVRPEYKVRAEDKVHERIHVCAEAVSLRVPCVLARETAGDRVCAAPTVGVMFHYPEAENAKRLLTQYVQDHLKHLTPRELSRFLSPPKVWLDDIPIRVPEQAESAPYDPECATLRLIAENVGDATFRRRWSRAHGREPEVADLARRIGEERANVLIVGEPGCGKTAILVDAVRKVLRADEEDEEKALLRKKAFWFTSAARIVAGMKYLGMWQERCEEVISELSEVDGVLCVDRLLELVRLGGKEAGDGIAAFLLPFLHRKELRLVAEATPSELDACRRLLPGLTDPFQVLRIPPMPRERAIEVLSRVSESLVRDRGVEADPAVPRQAHRLYERFAPYEAFPGAAATFLRDVFASAKREHVARVTEQLVIDRFVRRTGLPELFLRDDVPLSTEDVHGAFRAQVIGQDEACRAATSLVTTFKAGLNDPARPIGVLLFCGPTGVGKTELAKAIGRFFFGHGEGADRLVRRDMSEYALPGAAERLLGLGGGELGELVKRVRQQPFTLVLLDEVEKADPEVFDVLLGVFDEGRITDRWGRRTTFRSTVIVMTSNLGAEGRAAMGFGDAPPPSYDAEARKFFRPEFYNRLDGVVTFRPLDEASIRAITEKELRDIASREGLTKAGLRLEWTDDVVAFLASRGFDRRYGARPLQRALERLVVGPLSRHLVARTGLRGRSLRLRVASDQGLVVE